MPELLTLQDLANGHLDVKALGEAANGDENTIVTTRTGNTYPSAKKAIKTLFENGGLPATPFTTKALMTASALVDGQYAMVTDDNVTEDNGLYVKTAGAWVKSKYDPISLALKPKILTDIVGVVPLEFEEIEGSYYEDGGSVANYPTAKRTGLVELNEHNELWVAAYRGSLIALRNAFFDADRNPISVQHTATSTELKRVEVPDGARYIGVSAEISQPIRIEARNVPGVEVLDKLGDIDSLASDLSTVSGRVKYKNLIFVTDGYYWNKDTGNLAYSITFQATAMTEIPQGTDLFLNGDASDLLGFQVLFFDEDKVLLTSDFDRLRNYSNYKVNIPVDAKYVAVSNATRFTLTARLVGDILLGFEDINQTYEPVKNSALSSVKSSRSANFYDLGGNYAAIKAQRARDNYGILFAGQSNMVGQAAHSQLSTLGLPETLAINNWNGSSFDASQTLVSTQTWGIWWSLLKRLKDYKPSTNIYSYKLASNGSTLHASWNPHNFGYLFDMFMQEIGEIKKLDLVNIKAVVWWQGESDSASPHAENYEQRLKDFINAVRGAANDPLIPFVVLGVHKNTGGWYSPVVRAAQIRASIDMPNVYFVGVDDVPHTTAVGQGNHYDGVFFEAVAPRVFDIIKDL